MNWHDRFTEMAKLKERHKEEQRRITARQKEERKAKVKAVDEMFTPKIEKVCKAFAKALGYEYIMSVYGEIEHMGLFSSVCLKRFEMKERISWSKYPYSCSFIRVTIDLWKGHTFYQKNWGSSYDTSYCLNCHEVIEIPPHTITVIAGIYDSQDGYTIFRVRGIPFDEFTEEKLAEAFEYCHK